MVSRRAMLVGGAGAALMAGLGYRVWDRGVFSGPQGTAYAPWNEWRGSIVDGLKRPLRAAILAANPHDTQPWLFELRDEAITVYADRARNLGAFDPFRREMHLGLGAAIENLVRAAGVDGYTAYVRPVAGRLTASPGLRPVAVAHITMDPGAPARDPLFEAIPDRHTNRGVYLEKPVAANVLRGLADLVSDEDVRVVFIVDSAARAEMGALIVDATQRIIDDPEMSIDSAHWMRTGRREVHARPDGITIDAAGLSPLVTAFGKFMPDQTPHSTDQYWIANTRDTQVHAPVLGVLLVRDRLDMVQAINAGRAWQRLQLAATTMGIAAQPLNQPVECVDRNAMLGRTDTYQNALVRLAAAPGWQPTFTFRLGYAEKPAPPSPRRPLDDVIKGSGLA
jgi:nitroreductase